MIAAMVAVSIMPARAAVYYDGNVLYDLCNRPTPLACLAYVTGVVDTMEIKNAKQCIPAGVANEQLKDVVFIYLRDHPSVRHFLGTVLVQQAIKESFCPTQ